MARKNRLLIGGIQDAHFPGPELAHDRCAVIIFGDSLAAPVQGFPARLGQSFS